MLQEEGEQKAQARWVEVLAKWRKQAPRQPPQPLWRSLQLWVQARPKLPPQYCLVLLLLCSIRGIRYSGSTQTYSSKTPPACPKRHAHLRRNQPSSLACTAHHIAQIALRYKKPTVRQSRKLSQLHKMSL